jgi:O-acetylserine/cysteine efflux transporter
MNTTSRKKALTALTTAGLLWGTSVPLSKVALTGFGPIGLTVLRFTVAGLVLLAVLRPDLRRVRPGLVLAGALGYGLCIAIQNLGLGRTSVTHAALLIGAVPVLVAGLAVVFDAARVRALAWAGFAVSLAGIAVVAGAGGGGATLGGDALIFLTVVIGAVFTIVQARLLPGQDVVAVSTAQFLASAVLVAPIALVTEGLPTHLPVSGPALAAAATLATVGTVLPYTLFALGQTGVAPQVAGAFLNLETLVAAGLGATLFGEPMGPVQIGGALALLTGIWLSTGPGAAPLREPALAPGFELELEAGGELVPFRQFRDREPALDRAA